MATANIDDALMLISKHFAGVTDKDGAPYAEHCLRVMSGVDDPSARLVGLMHDLVEDTSVTVAELKTIGFSPEVVEAVDLITHKENDSYANYVAKLKENRLARAAKMSDLRDNASLGRVLLREETRETDLRRIQKYIFSYQFLEDRLTESEYFELMSTLE